MVNLRTRRCAIAATFSLAVLSAYSLGAGDTYYRWNDASGNPVNSDRPPPAGVEYDVVTTNTNTTVDRRADQPETPQGGGNRPANTTDQRNAQVPLMEFEKDPEACAIAQQNLQTLNTHARIRMPDADGNYRYLNEDEKANARIEAEAAIGQNCE